MSEKPDSGSGLVLGYKFDLGPACVLPFFFPLTIARIRVSLSVMWT